MNRDTPNNRDRESSFTKVIHEHSIRSSSNENAFGKGMPYLAVINYKLQYTHEREYNTIQSDWESDDRATKEFATYDEATAWLTEKGVKL